MSSTLPPEQPAFDPGKFLHKKHKLRQPTDQQKARGNKRLKLLEWQTHTLSRALELQRALATSESFEDGVQLVASWLKKELECDEVSISEWVGDEVRLKVVTNCNPLNHRSTEFQKHLAVHQESRLRNQSAVYPADSKEGDNNHFLVAHRQLAQHERMESARSEVLESETESPFGSIVMLGSSQKLIGPRVDGLMSVVIPSLTPQLALLKRSVRRRAGQVGKRQWLRKLVLRTSILIAACAGLAACWIPVDYRINCSCVAEPSTRRFAVARFDGLIAAGFVKPGDVVKEGDVLAKIDGRKTRWQLSSLKAEKEQSKQQRQLKLAARKVSDTFLAELETERLKAEESILQFQLENLEIKSPIDGVILQGSIDRAEAAAVKTGQVLFEIGPLTPIQLEASIPADQISLVKEGDQLLARIEGLGDQTFEAFIQRIRPRAEIRNGKNVFIADVEIPNEAQMIRPGMKGHVRIQGPERTVGWIIFRQPYEYLRTFGWW